MMSGSRLGFLVDRRRYHAFLTEITYEIQKFLITAVSDQNAADNAWICLKRFDFFNIWTRVRRCYTLFMYENDQSGRGLKSPCVPESHDVSDHLRSNHI